MPAPYELTSGGTVALRGGDIPSKTRSGDEHASLGMPFRESAGDLFP